MSGKASRDLEGHQEESRLHGLADPLSLLTRSDGCRIAPVLLLLNTLVLERRPK